MAEQRRIDDYALVSDCHTSALIADGSVEWLCTPRFDSASVFAAMLDRQRGGCFALRPPDGYRTERRYEPGTNVLVTRFLSPSGEIELTDCLAVHSQELDTPAADPTPDHALVRLARCTAGRAALDVSFDPRPDYARAMPQLTRQGRRWLAEAAGQRLVLDSPVDLQPGDGSGLRGRLELQAGDQAAFVLHYAATPSDDSWPRPLDGVEAIEQTRRYWRSWCGRLHYDGRYRDLVERSALVLKALLYAPTGAIIAAPTTSLPERIGGKRNWDYRYCWLRDSTFTLYAFEEIGFGEDARKFRRWLENASHDDPAELDIAYTIDAHKMPPEQELSHLRGFDNSRPVRVGNGARDQIQLDIFGELLDAAFFAVKHGIPIDPEYWSLLSALADYVCDHWREPDHGIWELRAQPRQFTYSKVYCWVCLDRAARIARRLGKPAPQRWRKVMDAIRAEVLEKGYDDSMGAFVQAYGSKHLDAANLLLPIVGFIDAHDPRMVSTVRHTEERLSERGFLCRYLDAGDGINGDEGAFTLCSFWLVDVLVMQGERERARRLFERLLHTCNDLGLLSEEYDPSAQRALGNIPQAFSHMGLITSAINLRRGQADRRDAQRSRSRRPNRLATRQSSAAG